MSCARLSMTNHKRMVSEMVECSFHQNEDGDWVCGWDEDDDFCTGYHCEVCSISLCSSECGDEYCARTRSPADKENNQCMMCAHPLEDEEYDMELDTWVKDGKTIEWESASKFSYPEDYDAEGEGKTRTFKITNITYDTYDEEAEEHQTQEDLGLPTEMVGKLNFKEMKKNGKFTTF